MLTRVGSKAVIGGNSWHSPTRQRFTLAHELGHILLHEETPRFIDEVRVNYRDERASTGTHRQEIEANAFAAALLVPEDLVRDEVDAQIEADIEATKDIFVASLAKRFGVRNEAMTYRLTNLAINLQI